MIRPVVGALIAGAAFVTPASAAPQCEGTVDFACYSRRPNSTEMQYCGANIKTDAVEFCFAERRCESDPNGLNCKAYATIRRIIHQNALGS